MTIQVKVYSDFVCPYCFMAETPLKEAIGGKDAEMEWMPFELYPYPAEPLRPEGEYIQNDWKESVKPRAEKLGISIQLPQFSPLPYTHLAHEGHLFAKEHGKGEEYSHSVFTGLFQKGLDIGNIEILTKIAGQLGLHEETFREALQLRKYKDEHRKLLQHAKEEANITVVPTIVIGDRILRGLHPKETIEKAIRCAIRESKMEFCEGDQCH
ncbi:DsbA family protein [Fictibacillus sp. Mic-4]|uniref:DsbA family oxidoreductase n=1 Tax=Fictibacillus sp. Mic-4 TaxID=3132826 RepID=UPI003CF2B399